MLAPAKSLHFILCTSANERTRLYLESGPFVRRTAGYWGFVWPVSALVYMKWCVLPMICAQFTKQLAYTLHTANQVSHARAWDSSGLCMVDPPSVRQYTPHLHKTADHVGSLLVAVTHKADCARHKLKFIISKKSKSESSQIDK